MDNLNLLGGVKAIFAAFKKYAPTIQAAYAQAAKTAITNVASNYQQLFKQFQTQVLPKLRTQQPLADADLALSEKLKKESEGIQASPDFEQLKSAAEQVLSAMAKFAAQLAPAPAPIAEDAPVATRAAFYAPVPPPPPDNFPIVKNVGKGGTNDPKDVRTVQKLLNQRGITTPILEDFGTLDAASLKELVAAIERFEKKLNRKATGVIVPRGQVWGYLVLGESTNIPPDDLDMAAQLTVVSKYDKYVAEAVEAYAGKCPEITVEYIKSIIAHESKGNPNAKNASGASGLMQIVKGTWKGISMPDANAKAEAEEKGEGTKVVIRKLKYDFDTEWADPKVNIWVGTAILAEKISAVKSLTTVAKNAAEAKQIQLMAFNGGQGVMLEAAKLAKSKDFDIYTERSNFRKAVEAKKDGLGLKGLVGEELEAGIDRKTDEILGYCAKVEKAGQLIGILENENQVANELPENPPTTEPTPKIELPSFPKINSTNVSIKYGVQIKSKSTNTPNTPFPNSGIEAMGWNTVAQKLGKKCFYGTFQGEHILYVGEWETAQAAQNEYPALKAKYPNARLIEVENEKRIR